MIIWIASYPRSGNTFFRILLHQLYGIRTYSLYNDPIFEDRQEIAELVGHEHLDLSLDEMARSPTPYFVKTHELPGDDTYPAIYLVRDGRDVLVSYAHFIHRFEPLQAEVTSFESTLRSLIVYRGSFGGWGPHVLSWTSRDPKVALVRFEDLIANPVAVVERTLSSLPATSHYTQATRQPPSFQQLHAALPDFFRKGQIDTWRSEMHPDLQSLFWDHYSSGMSAACLERALVEATNSRREFPCDPQLIPLDPIPRP
jgi:Sulfotransferase domain